jgi:hypothetical protein
MMTFGRSERISTEPSVSQPSFLSPDPNIDRINRSDP